MGDDTLSERGNTFNQLSSSSDSDTQFQFKELRDKLRFVMTLSARAEAMSCVALKNNVRDTCSSSQQHYYFMALDELLVAIYEQLDDLISRLPPDKLKE